MYEELFSFSKAFLVSCKLSREDDETTRDWGIRVLEYMNRQFPEKNWTDFEFKENEIRKRREHILYLWMVIYKIAFDIKYSHNYYIEAHQKLKKAMTDTMLTKINMFFYAMDSCIPVYKQIWLCYNEGIKILTHYVKKGKLINYENELFIFPTKIERIKNLF